MIITLPFPPSINHYWRHVKIGRSVRTLISEKGREFRDNAMLEVCRQQANNLRFSGRLSVTIKLHPPSRHRRDIDNYVKATLDALTHAGVWLDDEQIDELRVMRGEIIKGGRATVAIQEAA